MRRAVLRRRPLRPRAAPLARKSELKRRAPLVRVALAPASRSQRDKVRGAACIVCGARRAIDPAHLVPYLEPRFRAEAAHAVGHLGLVGALRRLSGDRSAAGTA